MGAGLMLTLMLLAPAAAQTPDTHPSANATTAANAANATPSPAQTLSTAESESESEKVADTMRMTLYVNNPLKQTNGFPWGFTFNGTDHATYYVDWGDGTPIQTVDHTTSFYNNRLNHEYAAIGSYNIKAWSGEYKNTQNPKPDSVPHITWITLDNGYTTVDATGLPYITYLNCYYSTLKSLDISGCAYLPNLTVFAPTDTIRAHGCTALETINALYDPIYLDLSDCEKLTDIKTFSAKLTYLNLENCKSLTKYANRWGANERGVLAYLNVNGCTALKDLWCYDNYLTSLDVSSCINLETLYCYNNKLTSLNVSGCTKLNTLVFYTNKITSLDVSSNKQLVFLSCWGNLLTELNVSQNTVLADFYCGNNKLSNLDLSRNATLKYLSCYGNNLTQLDLSQNTALTKLDCSTNQLREIKSHADTKWEVLSCYNNHLPLSMLYPFMARRAENANYKFSPQSDSKKLKSGIEETFDLSKEMVLGNQNTKWSVTKSDNTGVSDNDVVETGGVFLFKRKGSFKLELKNDLVHQQTTTTTGAADNSVVTFVWNVDVESNVYNISTRSSNIKWGEVPNRGGLYEEGKEVVINAVPKQGYRFVRWENVVTGTEFSKNQVHKFPATQDLTLIAYFEEATYDITVQTNNADWGEVAGGDIYRENAEVTITATPKEGYRFVKWVDVLAGRDFATKAIHKFKASQDLHLRAIFEKIPLYTIVVQPNHEEWGSASESGIYKEDSVVHITATAQTGYHFVCWKKGDEVFSKMMSHSFKAKEHLTLTAEFEAVPEDAIRVTVQSNGFSMGEAAITGDGIYKSGDTVTISATAKEGHRFVDWKKVKGANKEIFASQAAADTTFVVTEDMEIWAYFVNVPPHTITVQANHADWGEVSGGGNRVLENAEVTITATPNDGYRFVEWMYVDRGAQLEVFTKQSDTTFKATQNLALTAYFEEIVYNITAQSDNDDMGSVSGGGAYKENATVVLTANPRPGFRFIEWKNGDKEVFFEAKYEFPATENITLTAYFAEAPSHMINLAANNAEWGEVSGGGAYKENTEITIKAEAKPGYRFVNWKIGEDVFTEASDTTFKVTENLDLTAYFETVFYTVRVLSNDSTMGVAEISTGGTTGLYEKDQKVVIKATPRMGYRFVNWVRGEEEFGTTPSCMFGVTEDIELMANFEVVTCEGDAYVKDKVIYLTNPMGRVMLYNATTGQLLYDCEGTAFPVSSRGVYILRVSECSKKIKVMVL